MNMSQRIAVAAVDVAVLVEMCVSVYVANGNQETFTPVFFKYFFGMLLPTLIIGWITVKRMRSEEPEPAV